MANNSKLTIFEPLDSFTEEEKKSWDKYESSHITYITREGRAYVAPENMSMDVYLVVILAANQIIADKSLDPGLRSEWEIKKREAEKKLFAMGEKYPTLKFYSLFGRWEVPIEWFSLFEDKEREYSYDQGSGNGRINYITSLKKAKQRLNRAIAIVRKANLGNYFLNRLKTLKTDIEKNHYHPDSLILLSYSEVNAMFSNDELKKDRSSRDIWNGLSALEKGEITESMKHFEVLEKRWNKVRGKGEAILRRVDKAFENKGFQVMKFFDKEDEEL